MVAAGPAAVCLHGTSVRLPLAQPDVATVALEPVCLGDLLTDAVRRVDVEPANDAALLSVAHAGTGIRADDQPRIFEWFFRGAAPRGMSHDDSGPG